MSERPEMNWAESTLGEQRAAIDAKWHKDKFDTASRDELFQQVRLRDVQLQSFDSLLRSATKERDEARAERDEAQAKLAMCNAERIEYERALEKAAKRERGRGVAVAAAERVEDLRAELEAMRAERDDARAMLAEMAELCERMRAERDAARAMLAEMAELCERMRAERDLLQLQHDEWRTTANGWQAAYYRVNQGAKL